MIGRFFRFLGAVVLMLAALYVAAVVMMADIQREGLHGQCVQERNCP